MDTNNYDNITKLNYSLFFIFSLTMIIMVTTNPSISIDNQGITIKNTYPYTSSFASTSLNSSFSLLPHQTSVTT